MIDEGPNAASAEDVVVLTDSLGYVMSQASAFLLDADNADSFDFPANYVVLNFETPPPLGRSAALFRLVGRIDPELFETDTSGYTQFGRAYLSLQSDVPNAQFIDGYVRAAAQSGVEYTPIVSGAPSLFQGGAAFPGNDWTVSTRREEYLSRIPSQSHRALGRIRAFHLRATQQVLRNLEHHGHRCMMTWFRSNAGSRLRGARTALSAFPPLPKASAGPCRSDRQSGIGVEMNDSGPVSIVESR